MRQTRALCGPHETHPQTAASPTFVLFFVFLLFSSLGTICAWKVETGSNGGRKGNRVRGEERVKEVTRRGRGRLAICLGPRAVPIQPSSCGGLSLQCTVYSSCNVTTPVYRFPSNKGESDKQIVPGKAEIPRTNDLTQPPAVVTDEKNKKRVPWLSSSSSERHVLQCRCQSTPTQPIRIYRVYIYI